MLIQPIDWFLVVWFTLAAASTAYVAYDQFRHNPEPTVMKWAFILVTLYMGPVALLLYVMADKEPAPGEHEKFIQPLWKQGVGSTMHCVAGDATGIILAAAITALLGLPMWVDLIIEYLTGFAFGLFIFQALFMKNMMGGTYIENIKRSFLPEFLSMNAMMSGMAPVMVFLMMGRDMRAMDPTELLFWGVMSLGVSIGFLVAYPVNVWLVSRNLKHGLMTERASSQTSAGRAGEMKHAKAAPKKAAASSHAQHQEHALQEHAGIRGKKGAASALHPMGTPAATTAQLAAVTFVTILMLAAGMTIPALHLNMRVNAQEIRDTIMPPGMIMAWDQPAAAMREMGAVLPRFVKFEAAADARGDRELVPTLVNGVKVFELEASAIRWNILPDVSVDAYAINGQVPGPRLHIREGDHVRIKVTNRLPESTTLHWHGFILPNAMDGPADITQPPIPPGGSYVYEFTAAQHGTYFYHSHDHPDRQQALGLYGAIIIDPKDPAAEVKADIDYVIQLQEWLKREGLTYPAMLMEGAMPNYFTINGKAYPATDTISMKVGQTIKLRFVGTNNNFIHPMHIHGGPFTVVARDGITLSPNARFEADTINVGPGQRYDVIWTARKPGKWLVHCHIPHHTSNNNVTEKGAGGLTMILDVS
jgi:FtsP/CotA-like multicopper oxidase with cupredoxin domain